MAEKAWIWSSLMMDFLNCAKLGHKYVCLCLGNVMNRNVTSMEQVNYIQFSNGCSLNLYDPQNFSYWTLFVNLILSFFFPFLLKLLWRFPSCKQNVLWYKKLWYFLLWIAVIAMFIVFSTVHCVPSLAPSSNETHLLSQFLWLFSSLNCMSKLQYVQYNYNAWFMLSHCWTILRHLLQSQMPQNPCLSLHCMHPNCFLFGDFSLDVIKFLSLKSGGDFLYTCSSSEHSVSFVIQT